MDTLKALLPQSEGLLPKWLLIVSLIAALNSAQSYSTLHFTQRVYSGSSTPNTKKSSATVPTSTASAYPTSSAQVTPLSSRTFGTWTFLSAIIRFYGAYHISNPQVYQLCFASYIMAWAHFMSEWWVFGTTKWGAPLAGPVFVSTGSLVWMWAQWGYYVG